VAFQWFNLLIIYLFTIVRVSQYTITYTNVFWLILRNVRKLTIMNIFLSFLSLRIAILKYNLFEIGKWHKYLSQVKKTKTSLANIIKLPYQIEFIKKPSKKYSFLFEIRPKNSKKKLWINFCRQWCSQPQCLRHSSA